MSDAPEQQAEATQQAAPTARHEQHVPAVDKWTPPWAGQINVPFDVPPPGAPPAGP